MNWLGLLGSWNSAGAYVVSLTTVSLPGATRCQVATVADDGHVTVAVGVPLPLAEPPGDVVDEVVPHAERISASAATRPEKPAQKARRPRRGAGCCSAVMSSSPQ